MMHVFGPLALNVTLPSGPQSPPIVVWKPCPDAPTSRLKVGDLAYVNNDPPAPNRVRKEPNRQAEILGLINPGGSMEILEGPTCAGKWSLPEDALGCYLKPKRLGSLEAGRRGGRRRASL